MGRTFFDTDKDFRIAISTHSPRVGRTPRRQIDDSLVAHFNSLAPCGANRSCTFARICWLRFQLTRPVWGEPFGIERIEKSFGISTHSPRVGRTTVPYRCARAPCDFNSLAPCGANLVVSNDKHTVRHISTHSPRVGRTVSPNVAYPVSSGFQLTRPVWGEPI